MRNSSLRQSRRALTLVEMLVVAALIAVLVGLAAPALQAAREAARRLGCMNNWKQVGLALQQFHDSQQFLPPGGVDPASPASVAHMRLRIPSLRVTHGWAIFVLPQLEQQALFDAYQLSEDWRSTANQRVRESQLTIFHCPSSPGRNRIDTSTTGGFANWQAACCDYGVCNSIDQGHLFNLGLIDAATYGNPRGMMRVNMLDTYAEVLDGLSHTTWLCEDAGRPARHGQVPAANGTRTTGGGWADRENAFTLHGYDRTAMRSGGPCAVNCTNDNEVFSFHPGGATIAMGDGSVRFLAQEVDVRVVARLLTCAAGEVIEE